MKSLSFSLICLLFLSLNTDAQSIVGTWKSIDDTDNVEKSHIEIYEENGKFYGKVIKLLEGATISICDECEGDLKGKPITGMVILKNLEQKKDYYEDGEILDPASGKVYSCWAQLEGADKLKLRGFVGFSLLGRTQYWYRVK